MLHENGQRSISYKVVFGILITVIIMLVSSWAVQLQARITQVETKAEGIYELRANISSIQTDVKWIKEKLK